nr:hypothetical protein [Tanacetum cinerariifolium]
MASNKGSISKSSKRPKINITLTKQLFVDLTQDDTKTTSPKHQLSSPSAPNVPSKTPSTKDTSSFSIDYTPKSPTSSTSPPTNGYLNYQNSSLSPLPRVPPPPPTQAPNSMKITLSLLPVTPLDFHHNSPSLSPPIIGHPIPWNLLEAHGDSCLCCVHNRTFIFGLKDELQFMFSHIEYMLSQPPTTIISPPLSSFPTKHTLCLVSQIIANNSVLRGFFKKQKLTGPNFIDWYRQLRIVLSIEDKLNYLEQPVPPARVVHAGQHVALEILAAHTAWIKGSKEIVGLMLMTMEPDIQQNLETLHAHEMLLELKTLFAHHAETLKRNCPQYLAELLKKKKNAASGAGGSGIFIKELNTILNRSWIYDTGCGTYICNITQDLRASRKLKPGALSLYVGNGQREAVEAIGVFYLCLLSGLKIILNNCHYAPSITRGVISVSRLYQSGFINRFVNNTIQVSRKKMVYFSAIPRDGIFEIDLSKFYTNESFIYGVSKKRAKLDLDSALLWHCRLGHISKKRIEKLQHDRLLNLTDLRAFEKYVSYMYEKMARKPYTHHVERAKDLLGLIYTDHKHGVFETFKVFQKEVENQLGSWDYRPSYSSYTPQYNGVSERRNKTLLDMIRSMMSQTTLPKSFWDYALETAASILNIVPTKKVEKTPYEVWHGQAPKLSYLKV